MMKFTIEIKGLDECSIKEAQDYIKDAVVCWGKGGYPDSELYRIKPKDVKVLRIGRVGN